MRSAHAGFQLVEEEFNALVEDLVGALDKFNVPKKEKDELLGALGPLAKEIVDPPPDEAVATRRGAGEAGGRQRSPSCARLAKTTPPHLLEVAVAARVRGQRSYAEQLYSAAERWRPQALAPAGSAVPRGRARAHHHRPQDDARRTRPPSPRTRSAARTTRTAPRSRRTARSPGR